MDRLKAHEAKEVEAWIADHQDRLELFFLPRYAPERNPDEYLNNDLKGGINATGLPESKEELRSRILGFMIKLLQLPQHVCSYFQHPCVQYAAGMICEYLICQGNMVACGSTLVVSIRGSGTSTFRRTTCAKETSTGPWCADDTQNHQLAPALLRS